MIASIFGETNEMMANGIIMTTATPFSLFSEIIMVPTFCIGKYNSIGHHFFSKKADEHYKI